jgi:hypothetical protein
MPDKRRAACQRPVRADICRSVEQGTFDSRRRVGITDTRNKAGWGGTSMARPINSGGRGLMPGAAAVDVPLSNSGADSERLSLSDGATRFAVSFSR